MRCFLGLPLPGAWRDGLRELTAELRPGLRSRLSWTRPENWHLTLKFLGEVEPDRLPDLKAALGGISFAPFTLRAGDPEFFPDARRPRVFWLGLAAGAAEAASLARSVDAALTPLGFEPEARPFSAHLTICRVKEPGPDDWAALAERAKKRPFPDARADRFVLWQSVLGAQGPTYRALWQVAASGEGSTP